MDQREPMRVVDYASPSTPRRRTFVDHTPPEGWAILLTIASVTLGHLANDLSRGAGVLLMPGVLAGALWYVVARLRRRKGTRVLWSVLLLLATLVSVAGTVGVVLVTDGEPLLWRDYHAADKWSALAGIGVASFAVVEIAAWVHRRLSARPPSNACPPAGPAE